MTSLRGRIEELCAVSPRTSKELAALLNEDPDMVRQACYRLRNRGRLTGTKQGREIVNSLPSVNERLGFALAVLAFERLSDYLMTQKTGAEWERDRALGELRKWSEINEAQSASLPHIVGDILTAAFSGASAQAAQSTIFLHSKIEELIAKVEAVHNEINNLKTVNNDLLDRLAEQDTNIQGLRTEIGELRQERREVGNKLQEQITELKERTR